MASPCLVLRSSAVYSSHRLQLRTSGNRGRPQLSCFFREGSPGENKTKEILKKWATDSGLKLAKVLLSGAVILGVSLSGPVHVEAKTGVNKPELLPKEYTPVIDVAGFLSPGQENRLIKLISDLEQDTGYKLRILLQNYPDTPGLAIKDFWNVDERTIVCVADPTFGNILHFNVGATVDLEVPRNFWSRVAGKYGNMFYWKEKGEDQSIEDAVTAISGCLRDPLERNSCAEFL
ncbi:thylakoid lumen 15.0 kDa protein [Wolffia australiana]